MNQKGLVASEIASPKNGRAGRTLEASKFSLFADSLGRFQGPATNPDYGTSVKVCWNADKNDQGTVVDKNWAGVTIRWDNRSQQVILHNDMEHVDRVPAKVGTYRCFAPAGGEVTHVHIPIGGK